MADTSISHPQYLGGPCLRRGSERVLNGFASQGLCQSDIDAIAGRSLYSKDLTGMRWCEIELVIPPFAHELRTGKLLSSVWASC